MSGQDEAGTKSAFNRRAPTFALLDAALHLRSIACEATVQESGLAFRLGAPLPEPLRSIVSATVARWQQVITPPEHLQLLDTFLLRIVPVAATDGLFVGLFLEPYNAQRSGSWAREFFGLSGREAQVLDLLLAGHSTADIAENLSIASSTAADHIKRLLLKTESSSRLELFTKVLR